MASEARTSPAATASMGMAYKVLLGPTRRYPSWSSPASLTSEYNALSIPVRWSFARSYTVLAIAVRCADRCPVPSWYNALFTALPVASSSPAAYRSLATTLLADTPDGAPPCPYKGLLASSTVGAPPCPYNGLLVSSTVGDNVLPSSRGIPPPWLPPPLPWARLRYKSPVMPRQTMRMAAMMIPTVSPKVSVSLDVVAFVTTSLVVVDAPILRSAAVPFATDAPTSGVGIAVVGLPNALEVLSLGRNGTAVASLLADAATVRSSTGVAGGDAAAFAPVVLATGVASEDVLGAGVGCVVGGGVVKSAQVPGLPPTR